MNFSDKENIRFALIPIIIILAFLGHLALVFLILFTIITSYIINKSFLRTIGIEFVLFTTVYTSVFYGSYIGLIIGIFLIMFHIFTGVHTGSYVTWVIPFYGIIGFFAGTFSNEFYIAGIYSVLLLNFGEFLMTYFFNKDYVGKFFTFSIVNIIFNVLLFSFIRVLQ